MTAAVVFIVVAALLALDVYLATITPSPLAFASIAFAGALLVLQAALLARR